MATTIATRLDSSCQGNGDGSVVAAWGGVRQLLRHLASLPLQSLLYHKLLAPRDRDAAPDDGPHEGRHPAHTVGPILRNPGQAGNKSEDGSEDEGGDGPEKTHLVQHLTENGAGLVSRGNSLSVGAPSTSVDGEDVFNEIVATGIDLHDTMYS